MGLSSLISLRFPMVTIRNGSPRTAYLVLGKPALCPYGPRARVLFSSFSLSSSSLSSLLFDTSLSHHRDRGEGRERGGEGGSMDEESLFGHGSSQAHPHAVSSRRTTDVRALLDTPTSACYTMLGPLHWPRLAATPGIRI